MTLVGVTGGFCSGKTTVSAFFKALGACVINADAIVHNLYENDKRIKKAVLEKFGKGVFTRGKIDRVKLGKIAFGNIKDMRALEKIVHPAVIKEIKKRVRESKKCVTVIDAPLLLEAGLGNYVDCIVVVRAPFRTQIERCRRAGLAEKDLRARIAMQMPVKEKVRIADFIIDNTGPEGFVKKKVGKILKAISRR